MTASPRPGESPWAKSGRPTAARTKAVMTVPTDSATTNELNSSTLSISEATSGTRKLDPELIAWPAITVMVDRPREKETARPTAAWVTT